MHKLLERLEKVSEEMRLFTEITKKFGDDASRMLLYKKIEDGIFSKLHTANLHQLNSMKNGYKFRYYDKEIAKTLIDKAILQIIRRKKLEKIKSIS